MKILFFSHQAAFLYGGEICTLAFMRQLRSLGHEVLFASPPGLYAERAAEVARCFPVSSTQFSREWRQLPGILQAWSATRAELREIACRERVEILHATSLKAMVYTSGLGRDLPVLWHHHDILPAGLANGLWVKALASRAALVLAPSEATRASVVAAGVDGGKVQVLRNGFRLEEWPARQGRAEGSLFRVGIVGEISRRKGVDRLGEILGRLFAYPQLEGKLEFWIVGEGLSEPDYASALRAQLEPQGVRFLGRQERMREIYRQLDILLVPSRQDPLPTVIVEAGLSGLPVVASRAGGIPEMVVEGENGFLFDDEAGAAEGIAACAQRWPELARGARRIAEERYDIARLTELLLRYYAAARERYTGIRGSRGTSPG